MLFLIPQLSDIFYLFQALEGFKVQMHSETCSTTDLADLVIGIRKGVSGSEDRLVSALSGGIRFLLLRMLQNRADADDGVQDCLITVLQAIRNGSLKEPGAVAGFAVTVARRYATRSIKSRVQSRQKYVDSGDVQVCAGATQETDLYRDQQIAAMQTALSRLSESNREILRRFYLLGQTEQEIRLAMGLTETQFRLRKSRAKAQLIQEAQQLTRPPRKQIRVISRLLFRATA